MSHTILFAAANPAVEIGERFGFNKQIFSMHLVGFIVVAVLLYYFAYEPILKMLDERKKRVADSMINADKIKEELARAEVQRQQTLEQANAQAVKLIEEARAAAARVQEQETQKAIALAEQIIAKAREATAADQARMMAELKREIGRLVVETTSKVTGKILTAEDQQRLAQDANKQLAA